MSLSEFGQQQTKEESYDVVREDYEAARDRFLITDPDVLMQMMLDLQGYNSREIALLERAYKHTKDIYGDKTRDLSKTPSLLHAVRVAFPAPSEGVVPIERILGGLLHDLGEKPFLIKPDDFQEYGGGVVMIVDAITRREGEDYHREYIPRIEAADREHPELLIVSIKAKDIGDNSLDPFALPSSIERLPGTREQMNIQLDKHGRAIPLLFPKRLGPRRKELVIAEKSTLHALAKGKEANGTPNLNLVN